MPVPTPTELLFSLMLSYMGALEFFFIARNLYHWGFKHHRRMVELTDDPSSLHELQERIKAAIEEAKEKEMYGLNAMQDGVLYKDGFRVSPNRENTTNERHVLGSSRNSIERKHESTKSPEPYNQNVKARSIEKENSNKGSQQQQQEVIEEPFIKNEIKTNLQGGKTSAADDIDKRTNLTQTIKTQFGQTSSSSNEQTFTRTSPSSTLVSERPTLMPGKSDDSSSTEPPSTHKSDFSNQQSSSLETTLSIPEMRIDESERPEPDGQDVNEPNQYSDEYLRSLDGNKNRPLVRDDGTGRRRAFKKRRSSGDSTSSRESRASREEELKMFTSLEEEEFAAIKRGESEYAPIRYSSEPNLKVNKHNKRHRRSPAKGLNDSDELDKVSGSPPWGDIKPEHYKDMEFWKREKAISIEEEIEDYIEQDKSLKAGKATMKSASPGIMEDYTEQKQLLHTDKKEITRSPSPSPEVTDQSLKVDRRTTRSPSPCPEITKQSLKPSTRTSKSRSSSPARNISRLSSSEEIATSDNEQSENDQLLKRNNAQTPSQTDNKDEVSNEQSKNVSTSSDNDDSLNAASAYDTQAYALSNPNIKSIDTDENVVHDQRTDELLEKLNSKLRRSPRQDDIKLYEEQFIEEEKRASRTPSPNRKPSGDLAQESIILSAESEKSTQKTASNQAPTIEIDYAPDQEFQLTKENESDVEEEDTNQEPDSGLMEGISDFYDFNASINPSRSRSVTRSRSKSQPHPYSRLSKSPFNRPAIKSHESSPYRRQTKSKTPSIFTSAIGIPGVSDWYDYNVMLNRQAYGIRPPNQRPIHYSSTDFLVSHLQDVNNIRNEKENLINQSKNEIICPPKGVGGRAKSREKSLSPKILINSIYQKSEESNQEEHKSSLNNHSQNSPQQSPTHTPEKIPETPQYPRSFSAEWKDTERIQNEYKENFKRSTYVGESIDLSDQYDELREEARNFTRSKSKSRTPDDQDVENIQFGKMIARHKLQEKILAQITKTTLDYQDFAKDINYEFLDHERRGSDSALMQKSEILIQFQDNQTNSKDDQFDDIDLEAEEYHHFRRFSLQQEAQIEEYPEDEYIYEYHEIDLNQNKWINLEQSENVLITQHSGLISNDIIEDSLMNGNEQDNDGSSSEDERRTVIEVDDEIDEDVWDYERSDEFNEHSECEEAEREADRYAGRNAKDLKEEGAVGGVLHWKDELSEKKFHENDSNIKELYDDALKYAEEDVIEKDYANIIEAMDNEDKYDYEKRNSANNVDDAASVKTEDLINEILKEDEKKYDSLSPRSYKSSSRYSSQNFIDREKEGSVEYYVSTATVVHNTASTRLRSRYGLPPSTTFRTYDYDDDISVDLNYKPKKEYNWRKNFKIDDDDKDAGQNNNGIENGNHKTNVEQEFDNEEHEFHEQEQENIQQLLDTRKFSLGGESITLYSRSLESQERQLEIVYNDDVLNSEENNKETVISEEISETTPSLVNNDTSEVLSSKKKKSKKKSRKNSKVSLGEEEYLNNFTKKKSRKGSKVSIDDEMDFNNTTEINDTQIDSNSKKKSKKKKKVKSDINTSENVSPDIKSPEPDTIKNQNTFVFEKLENEIGYNSIQQNLSNSKDLKLEPSPSETFNIKGSSPKPDLAHSSSETSASKLSSKSPEQNISTEQSTNTTDKSETQKTRPQLQRSDSSGVYELIKDGSMYPWF